jgi:hypothetical protein
MQKTPQIPHLPAEARRKGPGKGLQQGNSADKQLFLVILCLGIQLTQFTPYCAAPQVPCQVLIMLVYSERYQAAAGATELVGFGNLNKIVEGILRPSEWLKTTFGGPVHNNPRVMDADGFPNKVQANTWLGQAEQD